MCREHGFELFELVAELAEFVVDLLVELAESVVDLLVKLAKSVVDLLVEFVEFVVNLLVDLLELGLDLLLKISLTNFEIGEPCLEVRGHLGELDHRQIEVRQSTVNAFDLDRQFVNTGVDTVDCLYELVDVFPEAVDTNHLPPERRRRTLQCQDEIGSEVFIVVPSLDMDLEAERLGKVAMVGGDERGGGFGLGLGCGGWTGDEGSKGRRRHDVATNYAASGTGSGVGGTGGGGTRCRRSNTSQRSDNARPAKRLTGGHCP